VHDHDVYIPVPCAKNINILSSDEPNNFNAALVEEKAYCIGIVK
jgi:hypothetical protein